MNLHNYLNTVENTCIAQTYLDLDENFLIMWAVVTKGNIE